MKIPFCRIFYNGVMLYYFGIITDLRIYPKSIPHTDWNQPLHGSHIKENLEKWGNVFQPGESQGIFEQTGKVREFYPKYWKNEEILASFYFYFFSYLLIEVYLLNRFLYLLNSFNKTLKKY